MLKPTIEKGLNAQINAELYSSYLYLSMSAYCQSINLTGAGNWLRVQAQEEAAHVLKLYDYILERGGTVDLMTVAAPPSQWASMLGLFEAAYEHEQKVSARVNALVDLAIQESDHATHNLLQWFVSEQVEEEASADAIVQKLKLIGGDGGGLFMIDQELGKRTFVAPATGG